jgi:DNA-binding NarL/FixJ family response regulator
VIVEDRGPDAIDADAFGAVEVVIVDDHRLLADSLALALEGHGIRAVLPILGTPDELLAEVTQSRPDLVLLDLDLGGDLGDGSTLVRPLVEAGLRVLIVTATSDVEQMARAVELGAVGVVAKNGPFPELLDSVVTAARGGEVMAPIVRLHLLDEARRRREQRAARLAPFGRLTERESEVLRELARGRAVAEIARTSFVSEATVRSQVRCIFTKLGVRSQLEAVVAVQRSNWQ